MSAITVTLPVCPLCRRAGKIPNEFVSGRFWCTGPLEDPHKRVAMEPRKFQEIR